MQCVRKQDAEVGQCPYLYEQERNAQKDRIN